MIICFILIKNNLFCVDNVRRIYILINWMGLKGLKSDSLIWVLDVFAIAFRIYPEGPLIMIYNHYAFVQCLGNRDDRPIKFHNEFAYIVNTFD